MNDHKESTMTDPINPDYYDAGGRQLIDLLEGMQFSRGSAVKYLCLLYTSDAADDQSTV